MNIVIDGLSIENERAGIGQYGYSLINELSQNRDFGYGFVLQEKIAEDFNDSIVYQNFKSVRERIMAEQIALPEIYEDFDLVHFIDYSSPLLPIETPFIITIHDLAFYKYPDTFTKKSLWLRKVLLPLSIKRARAIIAMSENTKKDILQYFPEAKGKVHVIYQGGRRLERMEDKAAGSQTLKKYGIEGDYILGLGTIEPRKNLKRLILAFKHIREKYPHLKLVLAGKKGWMTDSFYSFVKKSGIENSIVLAGYVEQEDIAALYSRATLFVYPSLYEGFGLPPLEAMRCGVPVVVSDNSSLPEVVGNAGVYVDAMSVKSIVKGMDRVLRDPKKQMEMIAEGYRQEKKFSWDDTVDKTVQLYKKILEG